MDVEKPKSMDEYQEWLKSEHGVDITNKTKTYYEAVAAKVLKDFEKSDFWVELTKNLEEFNSEYFINTRYDLLVPQSGEKLGKKPFNSFLLKTFRKNILENKLWPKEPEGGWYLPDNWYSRINDIVRTIFVVKYLDGIEFMIGKLQSLCDHYCLPKNVQYEAKEEGYYAAHFYTLQEFEIPGENWDTEKKNFYIEIQVTSQVQDVIRKLLHQYYEERRKQIMTDETKWQWNYQSDEFIANYLGHILHYVEGMIMEVRERQKGGI